MNDAVHEMQYKCIKKYKNLKINNWDKNHSAGISLIKPLS